MGKNNRARLSEALEHLVRGLADPVDKELSEYMGVHDWNGLWATATVNYQNGRHPEWGRDNARKWVGLKPHSRRGVFPPAKDDPHYLLKALRDFEPAFLDSALAVVAGKTGRASELYGLRHIWAHDFSAPDRTVSDADADRALDLMQQLLESVAASAIAVSVRQIRLQAPDWDDIDGEYLDEQSRANRHRVSVVDRDYELARLQQFFVAPEEEELLVTGERYAGKSALLAEAFTSPDSADSILLGYFVADPVSERKNATSEALVQSLVHQAHVILQGEDFVVDSSETVNSGALSQLLRKLVAHAQRDGKTAIVIIDGIDQDVSRSDGDRTMVDVLESMSDIGLKLVVSSWSERIPERLTHWPTLPIQRNSAVTEKLDQLTSEVESLFDADDLSKAVLRFLTYAGGAFGAGELAQLCDSNPRAVRKILANSAGRLFSSRHSDSEEERWSFEHPKHRETSERLFAESARTWPTGALSSAGFVSDEVSTLNALRSWAESYANAGWPAETPHFLLSDYPQMLAAHDDLAGMRELLFDVRYLSTAGEQLGSANSVSDFAEAARRLVSGITSTDIRDLVLLGSIHDNYQRTPDRVASAAVEAVGVIRSGAGLRDLVVALITQERQGEIDWSFAVLAESGHGHVPTDRTAEIRSIARADPSVSVLGDDFWLPGYRLIERARVLRLRGDLDAHGALLASVQRRAEDQEGRAQLQDLATLAMLHSEAGDQVRASDCAHRAQLAADAILDADEYVEAPDREIIFAVSAELSVALVWGGNVPLALVELRRADAAARSESRWADDYPAENPLLPDSILREDPEVEVTLILSRRDPLREFVGALVATGNEAQAEEFVNARVRGKEYVLRQLMVLLAARRFDDSLALIDRIEASGETPASGRRLLLWKAFLIGLVARLNPDDGRRAVDKIRGLVSDMPTELRPHIIRYLCWTLASTGEVAEVDNYLAELRDPYEALLWQMDAALSANDLATATRIARHEKWSNFHAPKRARSNVLALLALGQHRCGHVERARETLREALSDATRPRIAVDTDRHQVVNAALGRDVDWDWLLAEASERSLKAISAAALVLPRPSEVSSQLSKVGQLLPFVQDAKALVPATWDDELKTSRTPNQLLLDRLGHLASAPDDSAEWHLALVAITDALAKAGDRSGVASVGERAFERLLRWYEQLPDLEQFSAASLELGGQTLRLRRLGVPVRSGDVLASFNDFATQYLDHFEHSEAERQSLALAEVRASRSLILAVGDEYEAARSLARSAAESLIRIEPDDFDASAWESALAACITALASIPDADPDEITRLTLYVGVGASGARLAGHLVSIGVDKARLLLEVNLAVDVLRSTSWVNSVEMLRTLDRNIIDDAARFEDDLRLAIVGEPPAG